MDSGKVVLGVVTGVAVGVALGVLFAPDKGSVTRRKLLGEEYADALDEKFNDLCATLTKKFDEMKEEAVRMTPGTQESEEHRENVNSPEKNIN